MKETKMLARLKHVLPFVMFQSIETSTTLGFPDVLYGSFEVLGVAELKELSKTPKNKFSIPWRPGQLAWYKNYRKIYDITTPYLLILTIVNEWYIVDDIKEKYSMEEIARFHVSSDNDLIKNKVKLYNYLFS